MNLSNNPEEYNMFTYTAKILSPFLIPAFSAAPPASTALTCCNGAYNSPLILLNCPPSLTCPRTLNPNPVSDFAMCTSRGPVSCTELYMTGMYLLERQCSRHPPRSTLQELSSLTPSGGLQEHWQCSTDRTHCLCHTIHPGEYVRRTVTSSRTKLIRNTVENWECLKN